MNKLLVVFTIFMCTLATSQSFAGNKVGDVDITYWVKDALRHDPRVDASEITASTNEGIVTLSGSVDNPGAKKYADFEAKKINGVLGVVNKITVMPSYRSDTDIRNAIRRRILNSAVIESQGLRVICVQGIVTLSGHVATWSEAQEAVLLASEVRGVKDVKNEFQLERQGKRNDQEIKDDAVAALDRDVYLSGMPIIVLVKDGVISLEGSVGNAYEKQRAYSKVFWLSGVKDVQNNLKVEWWENGGARKKKLWPSDDALKKAVRAELDQDTRVVASGISIKAAYGHVTLDGAVASYYQKHTAEQDVRDVVGVGWVTNNLFVRVDKREDWAIRDDVDFNLDTDFILEGFDLDTKVRGGVVTLLGSVHNWLEQTHAGNVASRIRGVKKVINNINVDWEKSYSDAALTKKIKSRLEWNWTTYWVHNKIDVAVQNGVAILTGDVNTWSERREADHVAFHTEGIWEVDNQLTVDGFDYPWDEWHYKGAYLYEPLYHPHHHHHHYYYDDYYLLWR
jgi:osmotically-inducible protein OsmY